MTKLNEIQNVLTEVLNLFEYREYRTTGAHYFSGGFAQAEYVDIDEEFVFIQLRWGVQNDVEDNVNTEQYKIEIEILKDDNISVARKVENIQEA